MAGKITQDKNKCFDCGACVSVCPTESLIVDKSTFEVKLNNKTCIGCGNCIEACSVNALKLSS